MNTDILSELVETLLDDKTQEGVWVAISYTWYEGNEVLQWWTLPARILIGFQRVGKQKNLMR